MGLDRKIWPKTKDETVIRKRFVDVGCYADLQVVVTPKRYWYVGFDPKEGKKAPMKSDRATIRLSTNGTIAMTLDELKDLVKKVEQAHQV